MALSSTARNGLGTWFYGALGYPVIWADQDAPRPAKPFGQLQRGVGDQAAGVQAGNDEAVRSATVAGRTTHRMHRTHIVSLQVFSDDMTGSTTAADLLTAALAKLARASDRAALVAAGVTVQTVGSVRDLTAMLPTRPESRAQVDITVSTLDTLTEDAGYIDEAIGSVTVAPLPAVPFDLT